MYNTGVPICVIDLFYLRVFKCSQYLEFRSFKFSKRLLLVHKARPGDCVMPTEFYAILADVCRQQIKRIKTSKHRNVSFQKLLYSSFGTFLILWQYQ
jgi:hypothetical protein